MKQSARKKQKRNFSRNSKIKLAKNNRNFANRRNDQIRDSCNYLRSNKSGVAKAENISPKI